MDSCTRLDRIVKRPLHFSQVGVTPNGELIVGNPLTLDNVVDVGRFNPFAATGFEHCIDYTIHLHSLHSFSNNFWTRVFQQSFVLWPGNRQPTIIFLEAAPHRVVVEQQD